MAESGIRRRTVLGASLVTLGGAACTTPDVGSSATPATIGSPPPASTGGPTPVDTRPTCVSLADHEFRFETLCGGSGGPVSDDGGNMQQLTYFGPVRATEAGVTAWFVNAIVAWDPATGRVSGLLAPKRSDSWVYAICGDATINASCDGTLAVHREGCLVDELKGHTLPKGAATAVLGVEAVDAKHLLSLGADGTLRLWDVESLNEVRSVQPEVEAPTWLSLDTDAAIVLVTSADGTSLQSFSTELEPAQTLTDLPASTGGWKAVGKAKAVAVADGANAIVTVDLADASVSEHKFQMTPLTVEALADSTLAVGMPARLTLVEPGDEEVVVRDRVRYGHAVGFSADGAATYLADGVGGVASFDTRSGALIRRFDEPGRIQ